MTTSRGRPLLLRYYEGRRDVLTSNARDADPTRLFEQLALAALPELCAWLAVLDPSTGTSYSRCVSSHEHSVHECTHEWAGGLDVEAILEAVLRGGGSDAGPPGETDPAVAVAPLVVEDRTVGAVFFARDPHATPWRDEDRGAMHDAATALGVDLERLRLREQSRRAVRASQRVASQLHQLISASLAVGTLTDEAAIAQSLARSARSVFAAERAVVTIGPVHRQLVAFAQRGRAPRLLDDAAAARELGAPVLAAQASEPWLDGEWLCAPVLDSQRRSRGTLAAQRTTPGVFADEDRELATLLGQLGASALEALELSRTIHDNETRLRILVDAAPISIVESDAAGGVRWWNRSASRLLRWPDFATETTPSVAWPADVHEAVSTLWRDLLSGGLRDTHEFSAELGARERRVLASCAVLPGGDGAPHLLTLLDDITDQRELREEVRHAHRMELRGQVASSVAHDFNNLITLILGYSELLARHVAGDETSSALVRDIEATSSRAAALTAQLQSVGRTSAPAPVRLDVGAALSANAEVLERIMGSTITVTWALADATASVTVDADLFEQMILNLSINARDAMPDGGTLHFATTTRRLPDDADGDPALPAGDYVVLTVADSGTGMDEATRARCFEPLFTTKGPLKGTGLGLASARRLVEGSGGTITCASRPGLGTTFSIWLPAPSPTDASVGEANPPPAGPVTRARLDATVLLVEDDPELRRLALQVLRRNGLVVHEASSAEEALAWCRDLSEPLDLLVSDVVLPAMTGTDLAAALQRDRPDLGVLLMSGTASAGVLDALAPDSASFLAKPFTPSALVDEVIALLARRARA